jgi:hypothetical protein
MADLPRNPFDASTDPDRHHIWNRLILADSQAFVASDWSRIENDFDSDCFEGIRCSSSSNPDDWKLFFPTLESYRDNWLRASREFLTKKFLHHTPLDAILARCCLDTIDINGDRALAHKKFTGVVLLADGSNLSGDRQTLYRLQRRNDRWKIVGFLGFLPL